MRKLVLAAIAAAAVAAFTMGSTLSEAPADRSASDGSRRLTAFNSCGDLVSYAKRHALRLTGPYGLSGGGGMLAAPAVGAEDETPAPAAPAEAASPVTNVQEAGVDEPDIVKAGGGVIFALAQGEIQAVDASGAARLLGSLPLENGWSSQLLLAGDRLLVIGTGGLWVQPLRAADIAPFPQTVSTTLTEVDVSDPAAMRVVKTLTVDGWYVGARESAGTVRVVIASQPGGFEFTAPATDKPADVRAAQKANRDEIRSSRLANWVPTYRVGTPGSGGASKPRPLVPCTEVSRPRVFSGLGTLSVLTIDLARGVEPVDTDAVLGAGEMVYSSATGLYVATQRWRDPVVLEASEELPTVSTAIHKFDVTSPGATEYRASGGVPGYLLNQWSLSEQDGFLRVVSTDAPAWWGGPTTESASSVTVLAEREGRLVAVGKVGGLGRGERVYAVRFIGDLGFVVTFRQIDPLHVVDLSDPERPQVRGELELPGYSAYLHPIGDGLLLGVGQDATPEGLPIGTQVSVFDVSHPADPRRLHHLLLGQGFTEAEWDHHAFLYHPASGLTVLPFETSSVDPFGTGTWWSGAVVLRVGREGIAQLRSISHEATDPGVPPPSLEPGSEPGVGIGPSPVPIRRSLVLGGVLYTVSDAGVMATSLETLADTAWVPFASAGRVK